MTAQEMFESMGFKKDKFDYFGLDRLVYKKPIVDEGDYLYTFVVLFDKEEKLFYRDHRYFNQKEANGTKVFWGRGNGWVLGGLSTMP